MYRGYHTNLTIIRPYAVLLATYIVTRLYPSRDLDWGTDFLNWRRYLPNILKRHRPQPDFSNICRSRAEYFQQAGQFCLPAAAAPGMATWWSQPIWSPIKYPQQTSGLRQSLPGSKNLSCQIPRLYPTLPSNCLQQTLQLDEILSTDARVFGTGAVTHTKPS